ncbi:MAG: hypothetical protein OXH75_03235 [Acidobacteria bacterium]|nr:hypothetical protein [Acidobacteriota bacterium]
MILFKRPLDAGCVAGVDAAATDTMSAMPTSVPAADRDVLVRWLFEVIVSASS